MMTQTFLSLALFSLASSTQAMQQDERELQQWYYYRTRDLKITVTNLSYQQPMSPFFISVHDEDFPPLYKLGKPAPDNGLQTLAEDGDPSDLVEYYSSDDLKRYSSYVGTFVDDASLNLPAPLLEAGESSSTIVTISRDHNYVSLASMAVNTNDCFVGFSRRRLYPGLSFTVPGYDAGTEENNEDCASVPGPACAMIDTNNEISGNGEGVVHVHRGIHGVFQGTETDLDPSAYDWRNPMLLVTVEDA